MKKKTLYVDMDNVLVDFQSGLNEIDDTIKDFRDSLKYDTSQC
jgi:5'(3')-deoxyribonucleotidase